MANISIDGIRITGVACALPSSKRDTESYMQYYGERNVKRFIKSTGVKHRHITNGKQTASDLCYIAAKQIMKKKHLTGNEIDALVFITQTPDYKTPSTAFILQKRLKLKEDCIVFDINMGCTALIHGIYVLGTMMLGKAFHKALLLMGDTVTNRTVTEDHTETMMFGDAGAAVLIEESEGSINVLLKSDGSGYQMLMNAHGERFHLDHNNPDWSICKYQMNGGEVFNFSISRVPEAFGEFFKLYPGKVEDFDRCVFHQANLFILKHLAYELDLPMEKMPVSIDRFGNTNGASIPLTIVDMCEREEFPEELNLIVSGFGIGLSWGVMSFSISKEDVFPFVYTDDYFEEGYDIPYLNT